MKQIKIITLVSLLFFAGQNAQAQFWKKLKDRVERSVENTVLNKADRKSSEAVDDILDGKIKKKNKTTTRRNKTTRRKSSKNTHHEEYEGVYENRKYSKRNNSNRVFSFNKEIVLETVLNGDKEDEEDFNMKSTMKFLFDTSTPDVVGVEMTMHMESEEGEDMEITNLMIMSDEELKLYNRKTMEMMELPMKQIESFSYDKYWDKEMKLVKTGRSQIILGYRCDEYRFHNDKDDTEGHFFVTRTPVFNNQVMKRVAARTAQHELFKKGGTILKGEFTIKDGGSMTITPISTSSTHMRIDEKDYN